MTECKPDVQILGRYQTVAAARLLGVTRHAISRWATAGILRAGGVTSSGRVWYSGRDLLACWHWYWGKR